MPQIPDRWIPYKACGTIIEGTRIICFKVPLKKSVQSGNRDIKEIWDIPALLAKIPKLTAVIDLTNTSRYYDPRELEAAGVLHKKILIPGRIIPPQNKVTEFINTVEEFLGNGSDSLLGVHCTHGLNRTGYMVCRYMRDRLGMPAKDAIKKFEKARGYQIERDNYIADLLGKPVPPPDEGKETKLKPFHRKDSMTYKSPLGYDDEEEGYTYTQSYSRGRYGFSNKRSGSDEYRRDRSENRYRESNRSSKSHKSNKSTDRSYYKYDY